MKKIGILMICVLAVWCLNAQPKKITKTIISGVLRVPDSSTLIRLRVFDNLLPDNFPDKQIDKISANGFFHFELNIDHPVYIDFDTNKTNKLYFKTIETGDCAFKDGVRSILYNASILIEPGDSIHFDLRNIINYCSIIASGKGSEKVRCIQDIFKSTRNYNSIVMNKTNWRLRDSVQMEILNAIKRYKSLLTPVAYDIIKAEYCLMLLRDVSELVREGLIDITDKEVRKKYDTSILRSRLYIDPTNPNIIFANEVTAVLTRRALVDFAIKNNIKFPGDFTDGNFNPAYFNAIGKNYNGIIKYKLLAYYLIRKCSRFGLSEGLISSAKKFLMDPQPTNIYKERVKQSIKQWEDKLAPAASSYQFSLPDTAGHIIQMNDFRGKVVLIDFMFNKCPGCRTMAPVISKFEEHFKNKNDIAFVAISTDNTIPEWKMAIGSSSSPTSLQLYTEGKGINHPIIQHYRIATYPTLVLIDQDGKLITARAPDPRKDDGKALMTLIKNTIQKFNSKNQSSQ
jgi:thiol-disulfide isomerase/thioredoxin